MDYGECMQRESGKLSSLEMNESFFSVQGYVEWWVKKDGDIFSPFPAQSPVHFVYACLSY